MNEQALIERLSRNSSREEANDFLQSLDTDSMIDLSIELLGGF